MNAKIKNSLNFLNYHIGNRLFLTICFALFILIFIYAYYVGDTFTILYLNHNFFTGVIVFFEQPIIIVILILLPMLINAISVTYNSNKFGSNLLRFKTKKEYINYLINSCLKVNSIFFLIIVFVLFIATFCLIDSNISIIYDTNYKTLNIIYLIVFLFKLYFIGQFLSLLSILFMKISKIFTVILNIFSYYSVLTYFDRNILSVFNMPLLIGDYLHTLTYKSFSLEIICFMLFCILLFILFWLVYMRCNKVIKNIGEI